LLGLIAVVERSSTAESGVHGYDLGRSFSDGPLGEIIRLEPGMLYHYLKKLGKAGLISTSIERQPTRPDRQDHQLTDAGRAILNAWLGAPVRATRDVRLDFLVKLYFARQLSPSRAVELVSEQRSVIVESLTSLSRQLDTVAPAPGADAEIRGDVLRLRIAQTNSVLAWLDALPEAAEALDNE
jgi:DNA-binding PadR family transcriptional regulator